MRNMIFYNSNESSYKIVFMDDKCRRKSISQSYIRTFADKQKTQESQHNHKKYNVNHDYKIDTEPSSFAIFSDFAARRTTRLASPAPWGRGGVGVGSRGRGRSGISFLFHQKAEQHCK